MAMEETITLEMDDATRKGVRITRKQPEYCSNPVSGLVWTIIPYPHCALARQQKGYPGLHMQLVEMEAGETVEQQFTVRRPMVYMVFLLAGKITFKDGQGEVIAEAKARSFYMSYVHSDTITYRVEQGRHVIMAVAFDQDWLLPVRQRYPEFWELLDSWQREDEGAVVLPQCTVGQRVKKRLDNIRKTVIYSLHDHLKISEYLMECIHIYHELLKANRQVTVPTDDVLIKRLTDYLRKHYADMDMCKMDRICQSCGLTIWTIKKLSHAYQGKRI